jgi:hypothetical protein
VNGAGASQANLSLGGLVNGLLACRPLPADSTRQLIGPAGGTIRVGPHTLVFPRGAVPAPITISAVAPSATVNSVILSPHGLQFTGPRPQLTMSYANCSLLPRLLPHRIAYTNDLLAILEVLNSVDNLFRSQVSAPLDHFSRYAVAW